MLLLAAACAGSGSGASTTTSAAATDSMTASMSDHLTASMTESMSPSASGMSDDMHASMSDSMTTSMTESMSGEASMGVSITTASSDFGEILFDGHRQAIYLFDKETSSTPDCYGDCAAAWPPVLTSGTPVAGGGIDAALLGTTTRTDGTTQVTYANHPLYYYAHEGPGEVTCHNVSEFGGVWLVVTPSGDAAPA